MPRPEFPADQDNPFSAESEPERPILDPAVVAIVSAWCGCVVTLYSDREFIVRTGMVAVAGLIMWAVVRAARPPRR